MNKQINMLIRQALLTISVRDIMDEIYLKTLRAPLPMKLANDKKHFRELEKQHSKKNKKLYNKGY